MTKRRTICVVTGTRAEYGLLHWILREIQSEPDLELQIVATGMHLSPEFGLTYRNIEADGFCIDARVEMLLSSDTPTGTTKSMGLATIGFADAFERLTPDVVLLLGDRFEILAAAQAAMVARIPIAHIHGGETTEGAIDEAIRHSVTKMAHLHFAAASDYRNRVIQLGEDPARVFLVGAPGIDNIRRLHLLSRAELETRLGITFDRPILLVTYHPVTLENESCDDSVRRLLVALGRHPDALIVFTRPNADPGGRAISEQIDAFVSEDTSSRKVFTSLGSVLYLSIMKLASVVIGNSSSGLLEAPSLGIPCINIGPRQAGRLRAESVIDTADDIDSIHASILKSLSPEFCSVAANARNPYDCGDASTRIVKILKSVNLEGILIKHFYDISPFGDSSISEVIK